MLKSEDIKLFIHHTCYFDMSPFEILLLHNKHTQNKGFQIMTY